MGGQYLINRPNQKHENFHEENLKSLKCQKTLQLQPSVLKFIFLFMNCGYIGPFKYSCIHYFICTVASNLLKYNITDDINQLKEHFHRI